MRRTLLSIIGIVLLPISTNVYANSFVFPKSHQINSYLTRSTTGYENFPKGKTYTKASKFSWKMTFEIPDNWQFLDTQDYVYAEPAEGMDIASLRKSSIVVMQKQYPKEYSLQIVHSDFMHNAMAGPFYSAFQDSIIPSFSLLSSGSTTLAGHPALSYVFTADNAGVTAKIHDVITTFGKTWMQMYLIAPPENYDSDNLIFQHALDTLTIGPTTSVKRPTGAERKTTKYQLSPKSSSSAPKLPVKVPILRNRSSSSSSRKK